MADARSIVEFLATAKLDDASLAEPHNYAGMLAAGGLDQLEDLDSVDEAALEALGMAKIMHRKRFMRHMARMPRAGSAPEQRAASTLEAPLAPGPASAPPQLASPPPAPPSTHPPPPPPLRRSPPSPRALRDAGAPAARPRVRCNAGHGHRRRRRCAS